MIEERRGAGSGARAARRIQDGFMCVQLASFASLANTPRRAGSPAMSRLSPYAVAAVASAAVLLGAGCANDELGAANQGRMHLIGPAQAAAAEAERTAEAPRPETPAPRRTTPASKVLSAIVLERVTGLKPDPSRLLASD
jgi:hypothetical protein